MRDTAREPRTNSQATCFYGPLYIDASALDNQQKLTSVLFERWI